MARRLNFARHDARILWWLGGFIPQERGGALQHQRKPIVERHADKISQAPPSQDLEHFKYLGNMETGLYCFVAFQVWD